LKLSSRSFPFDVTQYYWPTFALAVWSISTSVCGYCGVLAFFFGICFHVSDQFHILSDRLRCLMQLEVDDGPSTSEGPSLKFNEEQNNRVYEKLKEFVKQHAALIDLCDLMTQSFTWIILCFFVSSAVLICSCCLLLFLTEGLEWMQYFVGTLCFLGEAFAFTYAGNSIINSSTELSEAAYNVDWYKCDVRNRRMILMIMTRAQKKICMKAPFFEASLESFVVVRT